MKIGMINILFIVILLPGCGNGTDTKGTNDAKGVNITQGTEDKLKPASDTVTSSDASWAFDRMIKFKTEFMLGRMKK
jgi:hypothetical protein